MLLLLIYHIHIPTKLHRACQLFASTYVKLADVAATKKAGSKSNPLPAKTQFHSVSCSQHHDVCEEYKITGFPTLLVLPKGGKSIEDTEPVSKDIVSGLMAGPGGYTLNSIAKAMKKAEANLDDGEEEEEEKADVSVVSRRLEDEEGTDDDAMSEDVEGDNDDVADEDSDNTDDDEASPEDADEWEKNDGPAPKTASTTGGAKPLANPATAAVARDSTYTNRLKAAANAARAAAAEDESPDVDESNEEAEEEEEEKDDDAVTDATDPKLDDEDSEDEDERPLVAAQKRAAVVSAKNKMAQMKKDIMDEDDSQEQEDGSGPATPLRGGKKTTTTFGKEEEDRSGDESREVPAPAKRVAATAAAAATTTTTTARKTTFQKTSPQAIVAAERGAASGDDKEEERESPASPPVKPSLESPTVRKFAAIKKVSEDEDEDEEDDESEAKGDSDDAENTDDNDDKVSDEDDKDDDDEVSKDQNDDEVPSVDDETKGEDTFVAARPQPPPGQVRPGASAPFTGGTTGMVPAGGPAGAAARAKFLAKTGMQPKDIQQYQQVAAQRRANLAQKAQKRIPPVFQGKKAAAARKQAAQALRKEKQSPAERQRLAQERMKKNKELLQKRIEMAKKIREQKRLAAANKNANGASRVPTTERVRSQGGPTFKKTTPTRAELKKNTIGKKPSVPKKILSSVPIVKRAFKPKAEEDLYGDAALSFVTGLKMGVYTDGRPLDQKRQEALVDWLELLSISLPPELGLHALIDDLLSNMSYISQGREKLYEQLDKYPLANKYWSDSCSKGRKGQGQNCGLWKLLHIVTIGFAEHRGGLEQQDGSYVDVPMTSGPSFTPNQGAAIIREYIALFFGCDVCKNNFLSKYDDCVSFGRCDRMPVDARIDEVEDGDWKELPLWLWEFHNHIAARIVQVKARRDGGRDDEVIGIWPNAETCFSCYNIDGSWNMEELYAFLETTYWYASSSSDFKLDRALKDFDKAQRISSSSSGDSGGGSFAYFALIGIAAFGFYASKRKNVWLADIQKHTSMPIARNGAAGKKA